MMDDHGFMHNTQGTSRKKHFISIFGDNDVQKHSVCKYLKE